jgi:dipeptidyl aminopeptidase/acylaminoacyl peptidase
LAYIAPVDNVLNVWVRTIGKSDDRAVTKDTDRGIRRYFWAGDNKGILYLQDVGGDENWRLYKASLEDESLKDLTPYEKVQVQIVEVNKHHPNELLIGMNKDNPKAHDVYHLNLLTGELKKVAANPGNVAGWLADRDLKVRIAMMSRPDGGLDLMHRYTEDADWEKLVTWESDDMLTSTSISFTRNGEQLYVIDSRNCNAGRLEKWDLKTGCESIIAEDEQYDVDVVVIHPDSYEVQAVVFTKARDEWVFLDKSFEKDLSQIRKLDEGEVFTAGRDNADDTWLVGFSKDSGPTAYYAYKRKSRKGTFLFDHMPALKEYELAKMKPISYKARDGLTIHGYLTMPTYLIDGQEKNPPMILLVHGGPWGRDRWGYNPIAQWFANRGYACLQVNFRGSTGYGKQFVNAGDREWAGKMHDDLLDGVSWAVKQGIANPKKVVIFGGSYGGYAALVGATFSPDVFCCAVDIVGPSNLVTLLRSIPPYWTPIIPMFHKRVGNPDTEEEFLKSRSPLFKVDQIKIPILIGQGANDPRVKQAESEQIVAAMKEKGLEYEYVVFPDEGHGFAKPENRMKFFAIAEKFLAKHLGGRCEP